MNFSATELSTVFGGICYLAVIPRTNITTLKISLNSDYCFEIDLVDYFGIVSINHSRPWVKTGGFMVCPC